jgi:hypothetical protein
LGRESNEYLESTKRHSEMTPFDKLKVGDRVKTKRSGMATVLQVGSYKGTMVKLKCDKPRWACPYFYESELEFETEQGT